MSGSRFLRGPAACLLALVLLVPLLLAGGGDAAALQEEYVFEGSGWGHGVGMCQYGARGMAEYGFDYRQILTYYYQGTQVTSWSCPAAIRVGLLEGMSEIQLAPESGSFTLYTAEGDIPGGVMVPGGVWTVAAGGAGSFVIREPGGSILNNASYGGALYVRGSSDGDVLRLPQNGNRGVSHLTNYVPLELNVYGSQPCRLRAVLWSWFETYLKGVAEVPGSWPQEAVKAQAVAARSYAVRGMGKHASGGYDLCDEVHCQYYQGRDKEGDAGWVQAVEATAGQVLVYGGEVAQCFYSSSCGGHTDNNEDVWFGSPVPYLRGVPDPYCMDDANPHAHWTVTYSRQEMEARLNAHAGSYVGTLYSMDLSDRTPSGRVRRATFTGSAGSKTITGEQLRSYLGLRSAMVNLSQDRFDEYILLANPSGETAAAQVNMRALSGGTKFVEVEVPALSRRTVHVDEYFYSEEVAVHVDSDREIAAERAMYFDYLGEFEGGSCGHGAAAPSDTWYLAEGYTAEAFDTWILIYNPGQEAAVADLDLLRQDGHERSLEFEVSAGARVTVYVDALDDFSACSFSAALSSDRPVVVERAMYFDSGGRGGGHVSEGSTDLSDSWYFAEGYTAGDFDTWVLVGNPHDEAVRLGFHLYLPDGGEKVEEALVQPRSRYTFHVDDHLAEAEMSVYVESDQPVVAERAMYFDYMGRPGGTCALGSTLPGDSWFLAEGYTAEGFDEYVLVANPGSEGARVKFSFLTREGFQKEAIYDLQPHSRFTLMADEHFPEDEVSVLVEEVEGRGIVVERAMYFDYRGRLGGHASPGIPQPSRDWYFAEGYTGS